MIDLFLAYLISFRVHFRSSTQTQVEIFLRRLEDKGYVRHRVEGRTNAYEGVEHQANVAAKAVRNIIDRLCDGSVEQLLIGMVDNEVIDKRELAMLARRISKRKKE